MLTINETQIDAIRAVVQGHDLKHGVGTAESMCSVAAMNIGLTGRVSDTCPDCMSPVIQQWIIGVQDAMPVQMINAPEWKALLPFAAGTGREHEAARIELILDWMWTEFLPRLQPIADEGGYGVEWGTMCDEKTEAAARAAGAAAGAARAARAAAEAAARAAWAAAGAAREAAGAAREAAWAARAAWAAAVAAREAAWAAAGADFWLAVNPADLLRRLIIVSVTEQELKA